MNKHGKGGGKGGREMGKGVEEEEEEEEATHRINLFWCLLRLICSNILLSYGLSLLPFPSLLPISFVHFLLSTKMDGAEEGKRKREREREEDVDERRRISASISQRGERGVEAERQRALAFALNQDWANL